MAEYYAPIYFHTYVIETKFVIFILEFRIDFTKMW